MNLRGSYSAWKKSLVVFALALIAVSGVSYAQTPAFDEKLAAILLLLQKRSMESELDFSSAKIAFMQVQGRPGHGFLEEVSSPAAGTDAALRVSLPHVASRVKAVLKDSSGHFVESLDLFEYDRKSPSSEWTVALTVPSYGYNIDISGEDADGYEFKVSL